MSQSSPFTGARSGRDAQHDELAALRPARLVLAEDVHVGEALRQAREHLDLQVEDIAQATHIRATFIDAIERMELDPLPARPFAVGYVRAYARALGLDPDGVAARFRKETPVEDAMLGAPVNAGLKSNARFGRIARIALIVVVGFAGWNLLIRMKSPPPAQASSAPAAAFQPAAEPGVAQLGAPLPPPPEASTPAPYETPGLARATAASGPESAAEVTARIAAEAQAAQSANVVAPGSPFTPRGAIYGVGALHPAVVLQALRPMSLVVRGGGGAVYFARQLAAGEAWRAPQTSGLTADADIPGAVEVYVQGRAIGTLPGSQTSLESLASSPLPSQYASH